MTPEQFEFLTQLLARHGRTLNTADSCIFEEVVKSQWEPIKVIGKDYPDIQDAIVFCGVVWFLKVCAAVIEVKESIEGDLSPEKVIEIIRKDFPHE